MTRRSDTAPSGHAEAQAPHAGQAEGSKLRASDLLARPVAERAPVGHDGHTTSRSSSLKAISTPSGFGIRTSVVVDKEANAPERR
jgi:hypothetical protein